MKILLLFLLFSPLSFAAEKDPRPEMQILAQEITALQKYLLSEAVFSAPENSAAIQKSLKRITEHVKGLPATFKGDAALSTNAALLASHMEETTRLFDGGKKSFARYMAQSSLQMCISCHTPRKKRGFCFARK